MRPQHRKFAAEYIKNGGNGVQAVYAAGYVQGYFAAGVTAHRLLKSAKIKAMIDTITEEAVTDAKLTEERVKKEIAKVAFSKVREIDSAAKMKGLDLATKVLGMQVQRIESTDLTELKALSDSVESRINSLSQKLNISAENAAIRFFSSLQDMNSDHAKPENFGKYQPIIENFLSKAPDQPIIEAGDQ